jgi:hypothetical protein
MVLELGLSSLMLRPDAQDPVAPPQPNVRMFRSDNSFIPIAPLSVS